MVNQHFFKPLLPGFHNHLTIPVAFLKYIESRDDQKTAELRSDASKITWKVKIDGQRLTDGWKEFALSHDLRIGDIAIFRQERDLAFHVTFLGPSCCEIQYDPCSDEESNLEKSPNRETESSSLDSTCFVANVAPSSLRYDTLHLPRAFVRENGVVTGSGEVVLENEKGISWNLKLRRKPSCGSICIRGWRSFCDANGLRVGDIFTFKLIQRRGTLVLRLLSKEPKEEEANGVSLSTEQESDEENNVGMTQRNKKVKMSRRRQDESSSLDPSCFVANVSPGTLRYDTLYLPKRFISANGLNKRCGEMILMNEKGRSWTLVMKRKLCGTTYIRGGWRSFCRVNGLKTGSFYTFKLIQEEGTLALRLTPNEQEEEEESSEAKEVESLSTEPGSDKEISQDKMSSQECSRSKEKKRRWKASSSPSENRFVTLTLNPYSLTSSVLRLPVPFTRINGITKETKMTLLDKHGEKWSTNLRWEDNKSKKRLRMVGGWKGFFQANSVKTNDSVKLELIWEEEDTSCVLKFHSNVKL